MDKPKCFIGELTLKAAKLLGKRVRLGDNGENNLWGCASVEPETGILVSIHENEENLTEFTLVTDEGDIVKCPVSFYKEINFCPEGNCDSGEVSDG